MRRGSRLNRLLDLWLAVPVLQVLALPGRFRRKTLPAKSEVQRLGVMCSPALGDTLLFSAALADLRRHFPAAEIVHLCMKENLSAAEMIAGADRRLVINLLRPRESIRLLRALRLDVLIDFTPWQRITALHTLLSGARFTAGFRSAGQFRAAGYDLAVDHRRDRHELENFRALVRALGVPTCSEPAVEVARLSAAAWEDVWMRSQVWAEARAWSKHEHVVVLHPWPAGAQFWLREWPAERWVEFAMQCAQQRPESFFVVTGSPADQPRVGELVAMLVRAGVRACGFAAAFGMKSLVALLERAELAVCVNTGILHLAAIVGTPTLGLNGPTAEHRWGPRGRCAQGVGPEDGSGGYLHFGYEYPADPEEVMRKITLSQVMAAADQLVRCGPVLGGEA